jgi:hypothetical protein
VEEDRVRVFYGLVVPSIDGAALVGLQRAGKHSRARPLRRLRLYVPPFELDGTSGEMRTVVNTMDFFNEQRFRKEKPPATFHIFTLGGSTIYKRPYDHLVSFSN